MSNANSFPNKEVIQSYILTSAKYDYNVYEKRILYKLVEFAQGQTSGLNFRNGSALQKIEHDLFGLVTITLPLSSVLLDDKDKNHTRIKQALTSLSQKYIIYEDEEIWEKINIIIFPKVEKRESLFKFTLNPKIWDVILDFSKGYRKYELKTAMSFESVYSMRFYELISNKKEPLTLTIDNLKELFQLGDKYKRINDFTRFVLTPAKKELDEKSPYTFDYEFNKIGRKYHSITFFPIYQPQYKDVELERKNLQKQVSPAWDLERKFIAYLKNGFDFTTIEIKRNIELFKTAQNNIEDILLFLSKVKVRANSTRNPKGYLINALKSELNVIKESL